MHIGVCVCIYIHIYIHIHICICTHVDLYTTFLKPGIEHEDPTRFWQVGDGELMEECTLECELEGTPGVGGRKQRFELLSISRPLLWSPESDLPYWQLRYMTSIRSSQAGKTVGQLMNKGGCIQAGVASTIASAMCISSSHVFASLFVLRPTFLPWISIS